jgi:YbbR domain-containing protein
MKEKDIKMQIPTLKPSKSVIIEVGREGDYYKSDS